jgi:hypothetical protein
MILSSLINDFILSSFLSPVHYFFVICLTVYKSLTLVYNLKRGKIIMNKSNSDKYVTVFTGAGISAESGIQTFRATDGTWNNQRVEDVASPAGFQRDPQLVWDFYRGR